MIARVTKAVLLAFTLLLAFPTKAEEPINYINMFIGFDEEGSYGLQKLTSAERARLNDLFKSIAARLNDNLRNSAFNYLTKNNWSEVQITGTEVMTIDNDLGPQTYITATRAGAKCVLEPKSVSTLMPGNYLGRTDSTSCGIINSQGNVVEFWIRQTEPGK